MLEDKGHDQDDDNEAVEYQQLPGFVRKKQTTLFKFGGREFLNLKGTKYEVKGSDLATGKEAAAKKHACRQVCPVCSKACGSGAALASHIKVHSEVARERAYASSSALGGFKAANHAADQNTVDEAVKSGLRRVMTQASESGASSCSLSPPSSPFPTSALEEQKRKRDIGDRDGRRFNRGKTKRRSWTWDEKAAVLETYEELRESGDRRPGISAAASHSCDPSMVTKWLKRSEDMCRMAADSKIRTLTKSNDTKRKQRPQGQFWKAELALMGLFKQRRARGLKVTANWLSTNIRVQVRRIYENDAELSEAATKFRAGKDWRRGFCRRHNLNPVMRRTNKRNVEMDVRLARSGRYLRHLRRRLLGNGTGDPKWGMFLPQNRLTSDQVPLPIVINNETTYVEKGASYIAIRQPSCDLDKRKMSLQTCIRCPKMMADGSLEGVNQPKLCVIMRGKGMRIS